MSANLVVDLSSTVDRFTSVTVLSGDSTVVGTIVDLLNANTYCQVWAAGVGSGPLPLLIQCADDTLSGSFTDPTSGITALGPNIASGGIFWANSGLYGSGNMSPASRAGPAPLFVSGGIDFGAFLRPQRYARLICTSGNASLAGVNFSAGFLSQKKTTGSGGGFTYLPGSGSVNV